MIEAKQQKVYMELADGSLNQLKKKHDIIKDLSTYRLKDGRPVEFREGKWIYTLDAQKGRMRA